MAPAGLQPRGGADGPVSRIRSALAARDASGRLRAPFPVVVKQIEVLRSPNSVARAIAYIGRLGEGGVERIVDQGGRNLGPAAEPDEARMVREVRRLIVGSPTGQEGFEGCWRTLIEDVRAYLCKDSVEELELLMALDRLERASIKATVDNALAAGAGRAVT